MQAYGLDRRRLPVDAVVSCGYKWLCGPYGTGFTWLHPDLLDQLRPQQAYWLAMQAGRGPDQMRDSTVREDLGARALDVFCPASFGTTLPWIASLLLLLRAFAPLPRCCLAAPRQSVAGRSRASRPRCPPSRTPHPLRWLA